MDMPVLNKDIEINGRKFRLNKMDARTGSYMLFKLIKILTPILEKIDLDDIEDKAPDHTKEKKLEKANLDDINLTDLMSSIFNLPESEFRYIQDNCLRVVEEILPAGPAKVLDKNGNYGVLDIEFNTALLLNLTIQSLIFNVAGFFEGSPLNSIVKGLNISQLNLKI